jgi:hypothetical protein
MLSDLLGDKKELTCLIFTLFCIPGLVFLPSVYASKINIGTEDMTQIAGITPLIFSDWFNHNPIYYLNQLINISSSLVPSQITVSILNTYSSLSLVLGLGLKESASIEIFLKSLLGAKNIARLCLFCMGFGINGPKTLLGKIFRVRVRIQVRIRVRVRVRVMLLSS